MEFNKYLIIFITSTTLVAVTAQHNFENNDYITFQLERDENEPQQNIDFQETIASIDLNDRGVVIEDVDNALSLQPADSKVYRQIQQENNRREYKRKQAEELKSNKPINDESDWIDLGDLIIRPSKGITKHSHPANVVEPSRSADVIEPSNSADGAALLNEDFQKFMASIGRDASDELLQYPLRELGPESTENEHIYHMYLASLQTSTTEEQQTSKPKFNTKKYQSMVKDRIQGNQESIPFETDWQMITKPAMKKVPESTKNDQVNDVDDLNYINVECCNYWKLGRQFK